MKKVIFLMIDSLMPHVLEQCIEQRMVPALHFFRENGWYWKECTSVFPTMTASVDFSLIAGEYPDQHRVPALIWYDAEENRLINYTNGALPVWKLGFFPCTRDVLCLLNDKHFSSQVSTIYEELAERGKTSGSINLIARRSYHKYKVKIPFLLRLATKFKRFDDVSGPDLLTIGRVVRPKLNPPLPWGWDEMVFNKYGVNDSFATRMLNHLIKYHLLPDFTMVYLPDNDHQVHRHPRKACHILQKVDRKLQSILNQFATWEEALQKYTFIITGDHGQTIIGPDETNRIDLEGLLSGFSITSYGDKVSEGHDIVLANNERMTFIYLLKPQLESDVIAKLQGDPRIDVIGWKKGEWVQVRSGVKKGTLCYRKGGQIRDPYDQSWEVQGDLDLLDIRLENGQQLFYGEYPDALSRLHAALYSQDVNLLACTAKPGYEFKSAYAPTHLNGGSHGSMHKVDSTVPLIISGALGEKPFNLVRLVDLKDYILQLLTEY